MQRCNWIFIISSILLFLGNGYGQEGVIGTSSNKEVSFEKLIKLEDNILHFSVSDGRVISLNINEISHLKQRVNYPVKLRIIGGLKKGFITFGIGFGAALLIGSEDKSGITSAYIALGVMFVATPIGFVRGFRSVDYVTVFDLSEKTIEEKQKILEQIFSNE